MDLPKILEEAQQETFKNSDALLQEIITLEKLACDQAMETLGLKWNGLFNKGHLMHVAIAYHKAKLQEKE